MCSASLVLLVDFLYPLDAVPCHYFSGGGDFTSRLAGLHSYSNARRSISSAAGARSGRSGEDDCSMNSDDGGADGSTNSPVCKRRPAQSSDGGAVRSASSTATATQQSGWAYTCVLVGLTSGRSRPLRDWHRALFALLLGEWHHTLAPSRIRKR